MAWFPRGTRYVWILLSIAVSVDTGSAVAADAAESPFTVELESGGVWQSRNDVQIPNDETGSRFSLVDVAGEGPWASARLYLTWNVGRRHGLRVLLAPLTIEERGGVDAPIDFAGSTFAAGAPLDATYQFNSWRLSYRYRFRETQKLRLWVGFSAKVRDARIELRQGDTSSKDTDVGFVPLLHLAADWQFAPRWRILFDFDGLAGGPGRAFDASLKLGRDFGPHWRLTAGYRTLEGGADVESVYNFAWLHYAVVSGVYRF